MTIAAATTCVSASATRVPVWASARTSGTIDSMVSTKDALYLIDLCGGPKGSLAGSQPCGAIYEVRANSA